MGNIIAGHYVSSAAFFSFGVVFEIYIYMYVHIDMHNAYMHIEQNLWIKQKEQEDWDRLISTQVLNELQLNLTTVTLIKYLYKLIMQYMSALFLVATVTLISN